MPRLFVKPPAGRASAATVGLRRYSCKTPLSLGGQLEAENFERTDLQVHYSRLGQIHRQTKDLPPGTKIGRIKFGSPDEDQKPKRWWQKLMG